MAKRIYVGNMSFSTTEDSLRTLFEGYGAVESVDIIKDRYTEQSKGFGFINMTDDAEADNAINSLNGKDFEGRKLRVNIAQEKPPVRKPRKW